MITEDLGYFEIGIYRPKHWENVGTLWRSAWQLGAAGIFTIGAKPKRQITDVLRVDKRIPLRCYEDFDAFLAPETRRIETPFNEAKRAAEWILSRWKPAEEKN